jgi:hypothetical protein
MIAPNVVGGADDGVPLSLEFPFAFRRDASLHPVPGRGRIEKRRLRPSHRATL